MNGSIRPTDVEWTKPSSFGLASEPSLSLAETRRFPKAKAVLRNRDGWYGDVAVEMGFLI